MGVDQWFRATLSDFWSSPVVAAQKCPSQTKHLLGALHWYRRCSGGCWLWRHGRCVPFCHLLRLAVLQSLSEMTMAFTKSGKTINYTD